MLNPCFTYFLKLMLRTVRAVKFCWYLFEVSSFLLMNTSPYHPILFQPWKHVSSYFHWNFQVTIFVLILILCFDKSSKNKDQGEEETTRGMIITKYTRKKIIILTLSQERPHWNHFYILSDPLFQKQKCRERNEKTWSLPLSYLHNS